MATEIPDGVNRILRLAASLMLLWVVTGCVSTPEKKTSETQVEGFDGIYLVENQRVEADVRQDFATAVQLMQAGDYPRAIALLEKVAERSQNNSAPYINLAMIYVIIEDYELAEKHLEEAMRINPEHPVTMHEYALLYRKTGRYDASRQLYESLVKKYPEFMPARKNLGILCELYLDDAKCALAQYRHYVGENPDDEDVKLWIVGLERKLGL